MEESRDFNRSLCKLAADLSGFSTVQQQVQHLSEILHLLKSTQSKVTKTTCERIEPVVKHLALSQTPVIARLSTEVIVRLPGTKDILHALLEKDLSALSTREVQLMQGIVLSSTVEELSMKSLTKQLGSVKQALSSASSDVTMVQYIRMITALLSVYGSFSVAGLSKYIFRGLIMPVMKSGSVRSQIEVVNMCEKFPGLLMTQKGLIDFFDFAFGQSMVNEEMWRLMGICLNMYETSGVNTCRVYAKDIPRWLDCLLRKALIGLASSQSVQQLSSQAPTSTTNSVPNIGSTSQITGSTGTVFATSGWLLSLVDAGWIQQNMSSEETKQIIGSIVSLIKRRRAMIKRTPVTVTARHNLQPSQYSSLHQQDTTSTYSHSVIDSLLKRFSVKSAQVYNPVITLNIENMDNSASTHMAHITNSMNTTNTTQDLPMQPITVAPVHHQTINFNSMGAIGLKRKTPELETVTENRSVHVMSEGAMSTGHMVTDSAVTVYTTHDVSVANLQGPSTILPPVHIDVTDALIDGLELEFND